MVDDQDIQSQSIKKYDHKTQVCGPVLGDVNMWIKLKISKYEEEGTKEDQNYGFQEKDQMYDNKRVCRFCNKVFSSGKALGGHARIHFQANKDLVFNKKLKAHQSIKFKKQQYMPEDEDRVIDFVKKFEGYNKKQTCKICGKGFPSEKSLFGHMRCHPERDWRGIQPPTMARNSSWSSSSSDAETQTMDDRTVDLTKSLKGWSVTAKRGRKAMVTSISEISSLEDDQFRDAVNDLMMLADDDSYESGLTKRQKVDENDAANSTSLNSKAGIGDIIVSKSKKQIVEELSSSNFEKSMTGVGKARTGLILETPVVEFEHKDCLDDNKKYLETSYGKVTIKTKKRRKKVKLSDLDLVQDASPKLALQPDKYHCSTCDKSFTTYQALGGHRSIHKKIKVWIDEDIFNPTVQLADEAKESEASNICRRVLDFDLNEVPPSEDEAGIESLTCS
ncbi:unnamed protein product [Fraxinus pennsylvanica]|uniref:C2H2-type domain-containing protein n=1 Tax=Fraxinus pennsylvanica TaxID=56036 RepID=A0AAD2A9K4_9LAMI|nr:unnamed protein product [Fraxinus pennsylvanica]